jgi:hypothetical protein
MIHRTLSSRELGWRKCCQELKRTTTHVDLLHIVYPAFLHLQLPIPNPLCLTMSTILPLGILLAGMIPLLHPPGASLLLLHPHLPEILSPFFNTLPSLGTLFQPASKCPPTSGGRVKSEGRQWMTCSAS